MATVVTHTCDRCKKSKNTLDHGLDATAFLTAVKVIDPTRTSWTAFTEYLTTSWCKDCMKEMRLLAPNKKPDVAEKELTASEKIEAIIREIAQEVVDENK